MQRLTLALVVASIAAAPAAAQDNTAQMADPDTNIAVNATDEATLNGLAADPAATDPAAMPPVAEAPGLTDATVTPETNDGGSFPWGLLGLLGLVGLIGRMRS